MTIPSAYISYDVNHNKSEKIHFISNANQSKTPFNIVDCSTNNRIPNKMWEKMVEDKIKKCNLLIVLVGEHMITSTKTVKEIEFAKNNNVPLFGIYLGDANSSSILPAGLQRKRTIFNNIKKLGFAIEQVLKEGKNKYNSNYRILQVKHDYMSQ